MKRFMLVAALATLVISILILDAAPQQPAQPASNGEVVALIQWVTTVADLGKAEEFYHGVMGLESAGGDPRMRLGWYGVVPFLTEMYQVKGNARNFTLRVPGTDMGVEPIQWSEAKGKLLPSRIQDPGAGHLILNTWNIDGFMERISKGGAQVLTAGGKPVTVSDSSGRNRVAWLREPNGFFIKLMQPDPPPPAPGANGAPSPTWYLGAHAGFAVEDTEKTARFYRDVLGLQVQIGEFESARDQIDAFGTKGGPYRISTVRIPGNSPEIRLVEFKGVDRKPLQLAIADPHSLVLRFRVRGIDALAAKIRAAGTKVVSLSGGPYANGPTRWFMVQGPDNVFVQLTEAPANAPNPGAPAPPR